MSQEDHTAKEILATLDRDVSPQVKRNIQTVNSFIDLLQVKMKQNMGKLPLLLRDVSIMHGGSAYEKLAVKEKVDFDIILVLSNTSATENAKILRDNASKFFRINYNCYSSVPRTYMTKSGILRAAKLQEACFKHLAKRIDKIRMPGAQILCRPGLASLDVEVREVSGNKISIDLAPQIVCHSWGQCPDLQPLENLPVSLRRHIDKLNKNVSPVMFFSPCVPTRYQGGGLGNLLCNVSFSPLEKKFLAESENVRNMVRLVKFVADRLEWKEKYALKSFYIKRVAIKYSDHLQHKSLWDGYKAILVHLYNELMNDTIDGFFVRDQITYRQRPQKITEFQRAIKDVFEMDAKEVEALM